MELYHHAQSAVVTQSLLGVALVTFPPALSIFAESEGYKPADFDRYVEISGGSGSTVQIDENMLLEAMPDFIPFLPRE